MPSHKKQSLAYLRVPDARRKLSEKIIAEHTAAVIMISDELGIRTPAVYIDAGACKKGYNKLISQIEHHIPKTLIIMDCDKHVVFENFNQTYFTAIDAIGAVEKVL